MLRAVPMVPMTQLHVHLQAPHVTPVTGHKSMQSHADVLTSQTCHPATRWTIGSPDQEPAPRHTSARARQGCSARNVWSVPQTMRVSGPSCMAFTSGPAQAGSLIKDDEGRPWCMSTHCVELGEKKITPGIIGLP